MNSYLKFLSRNKLYTAIEAVGLAVSLAFVILIGSYAWQQWSVTREHPEREHIYNFGMPGFPGLTYGFSDAVMQQVPEAQLAVRYANNMLLRTQIGEEKFDCEAAAAVGSDFFKMFPYYRFVEGGPEAFDDISNVVVSESFARAHDLKVGQMILVNETEHTVAGILQDFQGTLFKNADIWGSEKDPRINGNALSAPYDHFGSSYVFVKFASDTDPGVIYDKVEQVCRKIYGDDLYGTGFFEKLDMTRLDEMFFKKFEFTPFCHGDTDTLRLLAIVGLLLLFSAIFNYINLSFALTGKRAREMAMRRLLGAEKRAVIGKYIAESILFTAVCFALGLLLAYAFAPAINSLLNNPDVPIRVHLTPGYLLVYALLIGVVGTLAGLLPALLAGRYKPVDIVRGSFRRSTKMTFSKIFIVLQNALAVFLIAMALIMEAQYRTSLHRPLHANIQNMVLVRALAQSGTDALEASLAALPCVRQMGHANAVPLSSSQGQYSTARDGRDILYRYYRVDSAAFRMLGFEVQKDYHTPLTGGVWFGETAFAATGLTDDDLSIDMLSQRTGGDCDHVAGIIADFPVEADNMGAVDPVIVAVRPAEELQGYLMEISGDPAEARRAIQETLESWKQTTQVYYSDFTFVEDSLREGLRPVRNNMRLLEVFMVLAVIISLLGLVAMSTYYAGERASAIAVRKVFGGTVETELRRGVRDYMIMVAVACAIGIPLAVWAAGQYLQQFTVRLENYAWIFVLAVIIAVAIAFLSVLWQTLKSAQTNPAITLKKE